MKYIRGGDYRSLTDFDDLKVGTTASKTKVGGRAGGQTDGLIGLLFGVLGALLLSPEFHSVEGRVELSLERRRHGRLLGGVMFCVTNKHGKTTTRSHCCVLWSVFRSLFNVSSDSVTSLLHLLLLAAPPPPVSIQSRRRTDRQTVSLGSELTANCPFPFLSEDERERERERERGREGRRKRKRDIGCI